MAMPNDTLAESRAKEACDVILYRAATMMVEEVGAPVEMVLDRLLTYAVAQTVASHGKDEALRMLDVARSAIDDGTFNHLVGRPAPKPN